MAKKKPAPRPRRTREHIIASQSQNYIEKFFIDKGHIVDRPGAGADYGFDLFVSTCDAEGYAEGGDIRIQLKGSDKFKLVDGRRFLSLAIDVAHYNLWMESPMPVFLVLYDASAGRGYWLYVQEYFAADPARNPAPGARSITVRVPVENVFCGATVDYMRERKALVLAQFKGKVSHHGSG